LDDKVLALASEVKAKTFPPRSRPRDTCMLCSHSRKGFSLRPKGPKVEAEDQSRGGVVWERHELGGQWLFWPLEKASFGYVFWACFEYL